MHWTTRIKKELATCQKKLAHTEERLKAETAQVSNAKTSLDYVNTQRVQLQHFYDEERTACVKAHDALTETEKAHKQALLELKATMFDMMVES